MVTTHLLLAFLLAAKKPPKAAPAPPPAKESATAAATAEQEAIALYDAGRFAEAGKAIEAIEAHGEVSGPLLYRLHYCRRAVGNSEGAADALERARIALEAAAPTAKTLEVPFYLSNTYASLGRAEDARRAAAQATARFESGALPAPTRAIEWFQLAKLYEDQGKADVAAKHYNKALAEFAPGTYPSNVRWARRYIGNVAVGKSDWAGVEKEFGALAAANLLEPADLDTLARARCRLGNWSGAAEAWRLAVRADPANADNARYGARLAEAAAQLEKLPDATPDGAPWSKPSSADLEKIMKDQAAAAGAARERAATAKTEGKDTPETRAEVEAALRAAHPVFVAAALEYTLRGLPIRETAFREGYAVLVFQDDLWGWPEG